MALTVKHGSKKSVPLMKALWQDTFGDSDSFVDMFFSEFYSPRRTLLAFDSGTLVSMLYYMDVNLKYGKKRLKCAYLYGVATKLSERGQGYFHRLHSIFLEELTKKRYDAVLVIPESEQLFGFYRELGYVHSFKRYEYRLMTADIDEVADMHDVWIAKKLLHTRSAYGLSLLETEKQFYRSREEHKFFKCGTSYLAFAPVGNRYVLYEIVSPEGEQVPAEQIHYERSALLYDLNSVIDRELVEKQKPRLSYLLN